MLTTGFAVFLGVALLLLKLPRRLMLKALRHDLAIDVVVSLIVLVIHFGTFSGVMAATIAGLLTSLATSGAKRLVGFIKGDTYYPGLIRLVHLTPRPQHPSPGFGALHRPGLFHLEIRKWLISSKRWLTATPTPWHGLGNQLSEGEPLEVWLREAGMEWRILRGAVHYPAGSGLQDFADHKVLYRSDNLQPLSVVSKRYQVVQPREVLEFYRDLVEVGGFELDTAGVLKGGRKLWALAKTGQEAVLRGGDRVKAYLLLATACDGTLATTAQFTSVRVVCNNTLQMAVGDSTGAVKVPHSTRFDAEGGQESTRRGRLGLG